MDNINFDIDKLSNTPLYFVIGKERSGTTLLQVMLNAHPGIVAPPESRFIILNYNQFSSKTKWTEKDIGEFCDLLYSEDLFKNYWKVDRQKLRQSLLPIKDKLTYSLLCKMVFYHFAPEGKDIKIFIDKNPLYYNFIDELTKVFPDARFIHIVRDYRANILSHGRIANVKLSVADMAYRWMKVNELIENAKKKSPANWITVKYENLVTNPDEIMQEVCRFLSLPFDRSMVEAHNTKLFSSFYEKTSDKEFERFHKRMFEPINKEYIDEWKQKMAPADVAIAEYIAGKYAFTTYGYEKSANGTKAAIGPLQLLKVKLKYAAMTFYFGLLKHRWAFYIHRHFIRHLLNRRRKEKV